ncbi:hypothetical protein BV22DRAFT_206888 [Leucogyrophana mollusca]|uniref:Uncharacterized protein n=1 Tax=Leucogyrophana mollusca TaxID=85980 RepID=A0ACB8BTP2_9AGAM|nr:hypothetical protein BV22DRAFT_206888 [Leucogyrophana mollusca]
MSDIPDFAAFPQASTSTNHFAMDVDEKPAQADSGSSATASADPASSLRALALRSRKRRKVVADTLPPRPHPEPTMQLDYGQEDTGPLSVPPLTANPPTVAEKMTPPTQAPKPEFEDGQIREEGEISDTEGTPPPAPPPQQRSATPPKKSQRPASSQDALKPAPIITVSPAGGKTALAPNSHLDLTAVNPGPSPERTSARSSASEAFILETPTYRLDANHVRPGLAMTEGEYNTAKDIVLDLLGWGVLPEYLVDCGLSRQVIYYVFTELNLRLPSNIDTNGIIPYPTPEMRAAIPASPSMSTRSHRSNSLSMPPPSTVPVHGEPSSPMAAARLPFARTDKGSFTNGHHSDHTHSLHQPPDSPSEPSPSSGSSPSLLMIEQQRRQELLARKAVIASRKVKQSDTGNDHTGGGPSRSKATAASLVPDETVDDFLKTIEPVSDIDMDRSEGVASIRAARFMSPDGMDVDEIPGFVANEDDSRALRGRLSVQSFSSYVDPDVSIRTDPLSDTIGSNQNSAVFPDAASSTTNRDSITLATPPDVSDVGGPSFSSYESPRVDFDVDSHYPQRRGTKRPVAADFVDFDNASGPSRNHASNGHSNGGFGYLNPLARRKTGSFASVSGMRRCVIDLSDSEDDGDRDGGEYAVDGEGSSGHRYSPQLGSAPLRRNGGGTPTSAFTGFGGRATTPQSVNGSGSLGAQSPAALLEKEQEINLLRQLIAQREETRQKKLAAMSGKSTPTLSIPHAAEASASMDQARSPLVASTSTPISIKNEADDASPTYNHDSSSTASSRQSSDASNTDQMPHGAEEGASMGDAHGEAHAHHQTADNSTSAPIPSIAQNTGGSDVSVGATPTIGRAVPTEDPDAGYDEQGEFPYLSSPASSSATPPG